MATFFLGFKNGSQCNNMNLPTRSIENIKNTTLMLTPSVNKPLPLLKPIMYPNNNLLLLIAEMPGDSDTL